MVPIMNRRLGSGGKRALTYIHMYRKRWSTCVRLSMSWFQSKDFYRILTSYGSARPELGQHPMVGISQLFSVLENPFFFLPGISDAKVLTELDNLPELDIHIYTHMYARMIRISTLILFSEINLPFHVEGTVSS